MLGLVVGFEYRKAIGFGNVDTVITRYSRNAIMELNLIFFLIK